MQLLNASQMREWDRYTMEQEPVSSINLMERASLACADWMNRNFAGYSFDIFCGTGNNGGDGLAIARILALRGSAVSVFIMNTGTKRSSDFLLNLDRLRRIPAVNITEPGEETAPAVSSPSAVIIDAIIGTGLNRPLSGNTADTIRYINSLPNKVIAVDMPSGLQSDAFSGEAPIIKAHHTLTFQSFKLALLMPGNAGYFGQVQVLDIGLDTGYLAHLSTPFELADRSLFQTWYRPRSAHAHKGNFGHALIIAGSRGKMGAAVLSTKACLRSGAGLVTAHIPAGGLCIMQTSAPEAMCHTDIAPDKLTGIGYSLQAYTAIGAGPGIGNDANTQKMIHWVLQHHRQPLVLDADALNILSENKNWLHDLPEHSILTPHPKEFTRLFGEQPNDFARIETALEQAAKLNVIIVLKGHHTFTATPEGKGYFNTTGNAGMAKGGSGDVLTGLITGLLAQGYTPAIAAAMGVYLHGLAGDKAASLYGTDAMIAGDLIECLKWIPERTE